MNDVRRILARSAFFAFILVMLVITSCSTSVGAPEAETAGPAADVQQMNQAVLAEAGSQSAGPAATALSAVDTDEITEAVVAEVESRLAGQVASAVPSVDTDAIVQSILAQVEAQLAEQSAELPVGYGNASVGAAAETLEDTLIDVYRKANPAVVYIVTSVGSGSGFVYSADGYIATNNHVIEGGRSYEVVFYNGERRRAELKGADVDSDLAVIKVDGLPEGVEPLPLAEADDIQVGQFVVAIGNPFGEQGSMSLGIISGLGRSLPSQRDTLSGGTYSLPQVIQTDAPINPGNSGGPLLNLAGEVVGVNSAIASTTGTNSGVGFSIPVAAVRRVIPSLMEKGKHAYPYMGASFASEITLDGQSALELPQTQGAYVVGVTQGGPADEAGLIPADPTTGHGGDLIIQIDDQQINDFSGLNSYLVFHTTVGQTIQVTVLRDGEHVQVPLTLGARP